ncbi:uncharacterized protein DDB_G0290685-like isoform X2 [Diaphorina citri]|uniref:Uncharacterized protein DDB_G0290685-like isoform X2 n=1 Tax=Diaphorina citri TaxID=121845 RepID=A0A3Q0JGF5_DIACI|nr:uncharacterized protein DDB_G0290685-like isoform X2 [Diaphorina citri]
MFSQFRSKDKNSNDENKTKNVNNNEKEKEKGEKNNNKDQQNNKDRDSKGSTDNKQDTKNKQTSNKETGGNKNNPNQKSKDTGKEDQSKHQQTRGDNGDGQGQSKVKHSEESRKTDKQTGEKNERNKQYGGNEERNKQYGGNEERNKQYGGNDTHPGYKSYGDTNSNEQWKTSSFERNNETGHKGKTNEQGYRDNRYVDNRGEGDQKKHHGQGKYTSDEYPTGGGGRDPYSRKQDDSHVTGIILIASEDKLPGHYKHHHQGDNARHNKYQEDARNTYQQGEEGRVKYPGDMDGRNTHKKGTGEQFGSHQLHKDKRQQLLPAGDFAAKYNESIPAAGGEKHGADKFGGSGGGKTNEADKYQHRFNKGRKQKSSSLESSSEEELEDDVEKELKEIEEEEKRKKRDKKLGQMGKNSSSTSSGESMTKKLSEGFSKLGKK